MQIKMADNQYKKEPGHMPCWCHYYLAIKLYRHICNACLFLEISNIDMNYQYVSGKKKYLKYVYLYIIILSECKAVILSKQANQPHVLIVKSVAWLIDQKLA